MGTAIFNKGTPLAFVPDVVTSEDHKSTSEVSAFAMEDGTVKSDHIILAPDEVTISFELSNRETGLNREVNENKNGEVSENKLGENAKKLFEQLKAARVKRDLLEVVTRHQTYKNMVIKDITANHSGPFTGRLICTVTFKEFPIVTLASVDIKETTLGDKHKKTASTEVDSGPVDGKEASKTILQKLGSFIGRSAFDIFG